MKLKLDMSLFSEEEIKLVTGNMGGLVNKDNPHYSRVKLYYFNIETGQDEIYTIESSSTLMPYNLMYAQKVMRQKGYDLPYKTEWLRLKDPEEIASLQARESFVEL
jgi:hypothetical protein